MGKTWDGFVGPGHDDYERCDWDEEQFRKDLEDAFPGERHMASVKPHDDWSPPPPMEYEYKCGEIVGLLKVPLKWHVDDRGMLMEVLRATDEHYQLAFDPANDHEGNFGQNYIVVDPMPGTVRAFHKHGCLWDFFTIVNGSAKFVFYDDRHGNDDLLKSDTYQNLEVVITGKMNPMCIVVPPGVHHGWMSLEENTILLSTGTHVYSEVVERHGKPDECRIDPYIFGKNIWEIEAK